MKRTAKVATLSLAALSMTFLAHKMYAACSYGPSFVSKKTGSKGVSLAKPQSKIAPSIEEIVQKDYGSFGLGSFRSFKQTVGELSEKGIVSYNSETGIFEISNSATMSQELLEQGLNKHKYQGWRPQVESRAENGNLRVKFKGISDSGWSESCEIIPSYGGSSSYEGHSSYGAREVADYSWYSKVAQPCLSDLSKEHYLKDKIAEALQSESVFTRSSDKKPILATYGCGPCVAVAGWEPKNRVGFLVHFSNAGEVGAFKRSFDYHLTSLAPQQPYEPIQLHVRGGQSGNSEDTINAITTWAKGSKIPMTISSSSILKSGFVGDSESIALDTETGKVYSYNPLKNPHHREMSELVVMFTLLSAMNPNITLAYKGKLEEGSCK